MDADALEEDGLAIEQQLLATCLNGAETDFVPDDLLVQPDLDVVELGAGG